MLTVFFKTYGCQANEADSQELARFLQSRGLSVVETEADADLIIVNTCAIRALAEEKLFSYLGTLAIHRRQRPYIKIGVIGCVASYRHKELFKRFDHVNFVIGAKGDMQQLCDYLQNLLVKLTEQKQQFLAGEHVWGGGQDRRGDLYVGRKNMDQGLVDWTGLVRQKLLQMRSGSCLLAGLQGNGAPARINIMQGCNNYCSYCIVPFTRGRERSFSFDEIVSRVAAEVAVGAKEIWLLGQNVNSYRDPESNKDFPALLKAVAELPGDFWVRFMSPHPKDVTPEMVEVMAAYPEKLCAWIHLPLQSGSDRILSLMNRHYTSEQFLDKVAMIRQVLPSVYLSTDIIVGFPGETEEDYQATRRVMDAASFGLVYSFIYSPRKHTPAAAMGDPCPMTVKHERLKALQEHAQVLALKENARLLGNVERVLVEQLLSDGRLMGKTAGGVRVFFDGQKEWVGQFVQVSIIETFRSYVNGKPVVTTTKNI